ncbi:hypothetical protein [Sphingomonas sp. M1-B02]|uniref:hypothetical protein n=1 Tax=Sphingomonas sp. M1-B02 TaxID=3114300 RepID=UPI00223F5257|nr:hypothetical protein [Sphingomonas sp. S6-11]UZK66757.1 hypothetical protein OKW87_02645 [Sphingomonas sp. S6-11]
MIFMNFLKSLDDLLFEIATWLVFYPITLWRTISRPSAMMEYADDELGDRPDEQYTDTLSPPIFLLLTLLLSHALELALVGQNPLVTSNRGLASLITDDTSLLLLRVVFFSVIPLVMSVRMIRIRRQRLTRNSLRLPFYAQCYPTAVFALTLGIGVLLPHLHRGEVVTIAGWLIALAAFLWFGTVQAGWFRRVLKLSRVRAFWAASVGMVECLLAFALLAPLIA